MTGIIMIFTLLWWPGTNPQYPQGVPVTASWQMPCAVWAPTAKMLRQQDLRKSALCAGLAAETGAQGQAV